MTWPVDVRNTNEGLPNKNLVGFHHQTEFFSPVSFLAEKPSSNQIINYILNGAKTMETGNTMLSMQLPNMNSIIIAEFLSKVHTVADNQRHPI